MTKSDIVATWTLELVEGKYIIEFIHNTLTGRRGIFVNDKQYLRTDWMFHLLGTEIFEIGTNRCEICIDADDFEYSYTLSVNQKKYETFIEKQSKFLHTWIYNDETLDSEFRIVMDKETMDVYVNGKMVKTESEFGDDCTMMLFNIDEKINGVIKTFHSGTMKKGIVQKLVINDKIIE
ncbi:Fas apoptotic inhibitory molecule 1 [Intoshia linei]|uniref:Fas apoptotic inhibitory molecule 1 n=1 Tax=Intoshia linei TaxID=1819745 RepID=A0A177BBM3_9BILA|nr:Fas apoptotic inhibitory molecule 1 [Intoshia linei]